MFDSDDISGQGGATSRKASSRASATLSAENAALIHGRARARREKRPSPFLSAIPQVDNDDDAAPEAAGDPVEPPRRRLRDLVLSRLRSGETGEPDDEVHVERDDGRHGTPAETSHGRLDDEMPGNDEAAERRGRRPLLIRRAVGMALAGAAIGAIVALAWPKSYVATSEVLIDPRQSGAAAATLSTDALVDNQLRVLRSGVMLGAVADRLNLAADAEFNGRASGPFGLGDIGNLLSGDGPAAGDRRREVVETLGRAVQVERVGASSVVAISARTSDPEKSALISNTLSELFLGGPATVSSAASPQAASGLEQLRGEVDAAERAVEVYKAENELVDAQGTLITDDEIRRLGEQLSAARAQTVELNARAASTQDANVDSIVTGSLPEQYASATLTQLRAGYAAAKQQADRAAVKLGPRHPERLAAEAELEGARQEIGTELRRVASALQTELRRAVQQEQELASRLAGMKVRQGQIGGDLVELRELERVAEAKRVAYERALRAAEGGGASLGSGSASVISRAEPPLDATGPSLPAFSLAGGLLGLVAGLGFAARRRPEEDAADAPDLIEDERTETPDVLPAAHSAEDETRTTPADEVGIARTGKEAESMYPYSPYPQQSAPVAEDYNRPAPQQAAQPPMWQQVPAYAPAQQAPAYPQPPAHQLAWPQHMSPPPAAGPIYAPVQPYPAAPMNAPQPGYQAWGQPQPFAHYPAQPAHDPWAHPQGYAPPPLQPHAPAYHAPHQPQHHYQAQPAEQARQPVAADPRQAAGYDHDAFVDERTNAAIEEIRQSLREFREAIEDFAESREQPHRRYGT